MLARVSVLLATGALVALPAASGAVTVDAPGASMRLAAPAVPDAAADLPAAPDAPTAPAATPRPARAARPLAGRTVVLDPGHQLGNALHLSEIDRMVPAGPTSKPCNTTGTSTDAGYPEATFTWQVSRLVRRALQRAGARVVLTRTSDSRDAWGPCVDERGRAGGLAHADLTVSIHADGSYAPGARGFHVIAPASLPGWTDDVAEPSLDLALTLRAALDGAGLPRANYIAGGDGLDVRGDLGTLDLSDVPVAMVELGNMRDATEAERMSSAAGRARYAAALADGITRYLTR